MASTEQKPEIVIHHLNNSRSERICESLRPRYHKVAETDARSSLGTRGALMRHGPCQPRSRDLTA